MGGTILGASRAYVNPDDPEELSLILDRLHRLRIDGLICVGGDGTLNGLQPISDRIPARSGAQEDRQRLGPELRFGSPGMVEG